MISIGAEGGSKEGPACSDLGLALACGLGKQLFALLLVGLVIAQIRTRAFNARLYWATIVASTTLPAVSCAGLSNASKTRTSASAAT